VGGRRKRKEEEERKRRAWGKGGRRKRKQKKRGEEEQGTHHCEWRVIPVQVPDELVKAHSTVSWLVPEPHVWRM
jgi:hypothetical protein